jgi:hypothetical protein
MKVQSPTILATMTPTLQKAVVSTAEFVESVRDLAKIKPGTDPGIISLARRRLDEVRSFAIVAVHKAGLQSLPMDLANAVMKERRAHRKFWEEKRRERRAQREMLSGETA